VDGLRAGVNGFRLVSTIPNVTECKESCKYVGLSTYARTEIRHMPVFATKTFKRSGNASFATHCLSRAIPLPRGFQPPDIYFYPVAKKSTGFLLMSFLFQSIPRASLPSTQIHTLSATSHAPGIAIDSRILTGQFSLARKEAGPNFARALRVTAISKPPQPPSIWTC
jgi:hypothetical protein